MAAGDFPRLGGGLQGAIETGGGQLTVNSTNIFANGDIDTGFDKGTLDPSDDEIGGHEAAGVERTQEYRRAWQRRLNEGRWAAINWPRKWGGSTSDRAWP